MDKAIRRVKCTMVSLKYTLESTLSQNVSKMKEEVSNNLTHPLWIVRKIIKINHTLRESSQRVSGIIKDGKDALLVAALFEANMIDKCHLINKSNIVGLEFEAINDIAYVGGSHEATLCVQAKIMIINFVIRTAPFKS